MPPYSCGDCPESRTSNTASHIDSDKGGYGFHPLATYADQTREALGGYFLVEATDLDEALSIAERIPMAKSGTVEVRPIVELAGLPN